MTISCIDLELRMGGRTLLASACFELRPGAVVGILGPNGAGKSTLLSVLSGQRVPTRGRVLLDGEPLADLPLEGLARRRALMPQESGVAFDFSAREVVTLGRFPHRRSPHASEDSIARSAMASTDVDQLAARVLNSLSGGEKSRVQMARALAQLWHPLEGGASRWLLLDEPTAALDLAHQHAAMRLVRSWAAKGVGAIAVLHDLNLARRFVDEVLVLDGLGGLHAGPVGRVLQPLLIEQVWNMPCQAVQGNDGTPQFLFG
ncbi:Hemin import ATP-binding protein HmuV [Burkholderiales bacterium 8X]|nr:Hemin import ATP-binding protein HmuV [Burkholderiales bacterium 8X]